MNYFENIEGLLEESKGNIENIEKKTERSANEAANDVHDDSFATELASLSQDKIIEIAYQNLESLTTLSVLASIGEDITEAYDILKTRLNACLDCITDKEVKKEILTAMKKAFGSEKNLDIETSKSR